MDFVVLRQSMSTVQCVLVASVDAGVSTQMVHFAASLSKESIVDVEGIVTLPKEPFKATTQQVRKATASIGRSPHFRSTWTMQPVVKQNLRRLNKLGKITCYRAALSGSQFIGKLCRALRLSVYK
uniref:Uncharacterized protein n=2 Tax=Triticinae TaxID=1648030 RepID=A0A453G8K9_AEGTS